MLNSKMYDRTLIYFLFDWIGRDKQYYSLLVVCNETQIFAKRITAIGVESESLNPLSSNLRQFNEKKDWNEQRWTEADIDKMEAFMKKNFSNVDLQRCETRNYKILSFGFTIRPVLQYTISYANAEQVHCLALIMEDDQVLTYKDSEHYEFLTQILDRLELRNYYRLEEA